MDRMTLLDVATAQTLLTRIANSGVQSVQQITNTNDVFKVTTQNEGNFFVKFHTSHWYKDAPDTFILVQREAAVTGLLERKGIPPGYRSWTDCTRRIVNRSVLITSELPGIPVPVALKKAPHEQDQIISALARFLKRLHDLEFPRAGYIEFCGNADMPFSLDPRENPWWDSHPCQKVENFRKFALDVLSSKEKAIPISLFSELKERFDRMPDFLSSEYHPPHFVINNYHPAHVHVRRDRSGWQVAGLVDFEAASAGNPVFDLVGNDLQITPLTGSLSWRPVFYQAYGRYPKFEAYKLMLLCFLLLGLGGKQTAEVPDADWLIHTMPALIDAAGYETFVWYPASA